MKSAAAFLACLTVAGCTAISPVPDTPYPGTPVSANPKPRGTEAFCRTYARQTASNAYEDRVDTDEDSWVVRQGTAEQARRTGDEAYRRCLAGRTN
ncbi:hypothetical protein [Consotaella aegiceratis]|uniref:hypothetical protein n=1 Tax=Consotaella aegiceratis TaxID=3097961 RepID=UPI002F42E12F